MKLQVFKNLRLIITSLVLAVFLIYFFLNTEKFKPLLHVNGYLLVFIALANVAGVFINGLFTKFILEPFKKYISITEAFYVSVISSIGNFFAPAGTGFGIRAVYLKKKHGLPYSEFISTLSGNYILVFLVNSFIGLLALYLLRDEYSSQYVALAVAFGSIFVVSLLISILKIPVPKTSLAKKTKLSSMITALFRVTDGWNKIVANKKLMLKLICLIFASFFLSVIMYWAIIATLHLTITFPALLLFSVLGSLSIFVNITPANLGIKEAIYIFSSSILGFSVSEIILIALIERGVQFIVLLILWLYSSRAKNKIGLEDQALNTA